MKVYNNLEDVIFKIDDITLPEKIKDDLFEMGIKFYLYDGEDETFFSPMKSELWNAIEEYKKGKNYSPYIKNH